MDSQPVVIDLGVVGAVPPGVMVDGAVAELQWHEENENGILYTAEIRIPGHQQDHG
jgi:hypothetical protein